jgi:serine/threonine protein phosphatase 1
MKLRSLLRDFFAPGAPAAGSPPEAPAGLCVYAVGDVHGQRRELERLMALIGADAGRVGAESGLEPLVVFLGDYVDRGPDSRGVLDMLCDMEARFGAGAGMACRFLAGNHEAAMLDFLRDPAAGAEWLNYGGAETLASYGVRASVGTTDPARCRALRDALEERLPDEHRRFLDGLEPLVVLGDYAFVHAGIRPGQPLDRQRPQDLLWIREPFLSWNKRHEKVIVHGHTVVDEPEFLHNRIGVDTGAYATGILTALVLHGTVQRVVQTGS